LALSDRGSLCNQEEWLKELEDTSPAIEAEGQTTTSASCTKLLENGRDSDLWAENFDRINSSQARKAWDDIAKQINMKFGTDNYLPLVRPSVSV